MTGASEAQIATLREAIRRVGDTTRRTRTKLLWVSWSLFLFTAATFWMSNSHLIFYFVLFYAGIGVLGSLLTVAGAAGYRVRRRQRFRTSLAAIDREQAIALLTPLWNEGGETRKLVEPLLRERGVPTEVTPSDTPIGRGDEPAPAANRAE